LRERRKVVFPEPDGPINEVIVPRGTPTVIPDMIVAVPNPSVRSSVFMTVSDPPGSVDPTAVPSTTLRGESSEDSMWKELTAGT
jgi:hypothetical protein